MAVMLVVFLPPNRPTRTARSATLCDVCDGAMDTEPRVGDGERADSSSDDPTELLSSLISDCDANLDSAILQAASDREPLEGGARAVDRCTLPVPPSLPCTSFPKRRYKVRTIPQRRTTGKTTSTTRGSSRSRT